MVTGYGGTAGKGSGLPFDPDDVDVDDLIIIDPDPALTTAYTLVVLSPKSSPRGSPQISAPPPLRSNQPYPFRPSLV